MSATAVSEYATLQFAKTRKTTAFDLDNRQHEETFYYDTWIEWSKQLSNRSQSQNNFDAYRVRIEMLKRDAEQEEIVFNHTSEQDFWNFMKSIPYARKADVVVTDRGNLRAVWRGEENKHIGLQFFGNRCVEYVIWTRRAGSMKIEPKAGRDTFEGVKAQIRDWGLTSFLQ